jgi:hypothetical protein
VSIHDCNYIKRFKIDVILLRMHKINAVSKSISIILWNQIINICINISHIFVIAREFNINKNNHDLLPDYKVV